MANLPVKVRRIFGAVIDSDGSIDEQEIRVAVVVGLLDVSPVAANAAPSQSEVQVGID